MYRPTYRKLLNRSILLGTHARSFIICSRGLCIIRCILYDATGLQIRQTYAGKFDHQYSRGDSAVIVQAKIYSNTIIHLMRAGFSVQSNCCGFYFLRALASPQTG